MSGPLVSAIIPTNGRPELLRRAVKSVSDQEYRPIQLIIVYENPSDISDKLPLGSLTSVRTIENDGSNVGAARNTGIMAADGEYITFLDDDDWWEPTKTSRQVEQLEKTPELVKASVTGQRKINSYGETISTVVINNCDDWVKRGIQGSIGTFSMLMLEHEIALEVNGLDESLPVYEDHDFTLRIAKAGFEYAVIDDLLVNKGIDGHDQLGGDYEAKIKARPIFLEKHAQIAEQYGCRKELESYFEFFSGRAARNERRYLTALQHFLRCVALNPNKRGVLEFLATLGGPVTYRVGRYVYHKVLNRTSTE